VTRDDRVRQSGASGVRAEVGSYLGETFQDKANALPEHTGPTHRQDKMGHMVSRWSSQEESIEWLGISRSKSDLAEGIRARALPHKSKAKYQATGDRDIDAKPNTDIAISFRRSYDLNRRRLPHVDNHEDLRDQDSRLLMLIQSLSSLSLARSSLLASS
jgi:hypothetical protein